jgi:predicted DNA-binding transcriptional regulator AlpA
MRLTRKQVALKLGMQSTSDRKCRIPRLLRSHLFPCPVVTGGGRGCTTMWEESDIDRWLDVVSRGDRIEIANGVYLSELEILKILSRTKWTLDRNIRLKKFPPPEFKIWLKSKGVYRRYWNVATVGKFICVSSVAFPTQTFYGSARELD